jgi:hypothetical protein
VKTRCPPAVIRWRIRFQHQLPCQAPWIRRSRSFRSTPLRRPPHEHEARLNVNQTPPKIAAARPTCGRSASLHQVCFSYWRPGRSVTKCPAVKRHRFVTPPECCCPMWLLERTKIAA